MSEETQNTVAPPAGYARLEGSELRSPPGARALGPADSKEILRVMIRVRRKPGAPPLPDLAYWKATAPGRRKFLSTREFGAIYGALPSELEEVASYCRSSGLAVTETCVVRRIVIASGSVEQMNRAFAVELLRYETAGEVYRGREGHVHLPADIAPLVECVSGLDARRVARNHSLPNADPGNPPDLDAWNVAKLYNFPTNSANGQVIGIITMDNGGFNRSADLIPYFNNLNSRNGTSLVAPVPKIAIGTNNWGNQQADFELTQDICVSSTIAQGATILVFFEEGTITGYTDFITRGYTQCTVLSSSVHLTKGDDATTLSVFQQSDITNLETALQEAAVMGVTILASSGDDGTNYNGIKYLVDWPASNPWVTACGGTSLGLSNDTPPKSIEWVWNDQDNEGAYWATGGGVSDKYALPDWQQGIVTQTSLNDNMLRRGVPDVAGNASKYSGYELWVDGSNTNTISGTPLVANGTSIVAPLYAGLVAVINAATSNQKTGFLNPTLYFYRETLCREINDQLFPGSPIDNGIDGSPGYPSGPGWDGCTGLGVIDGGVLKSIFMQNFYFVVDQSTFGTDEVSDVIASAAAGRFSNAFWLVLEGFTPNGIASATPTFAPASTFNPTHITGLLISPDATPVDYELGGPGSAYADVVQRIRFAYDISFTSTASFPAVNSEQLYTLLANISIGGTVLSLEPETLFALIGGSDPYFTNVDSGNPNAVFYLSQDLRVFTVTAGKSPLSGATPFTSDPYDSIQGFLYYLNNTPLYTQPYPASGPDPLNSLPNQTGYETGETSVTPLNMGQKNYNFAIARVRLVGAPGTSSPNVRVFFRLWVGISYDTDFNHNTTYPSQLGTVPSSPDYNLPVFPEPSGLGLVDPQGNTLQTIPYFATDSMGSNDYNATYAPPNEDNNIRTIMIPAMQDTVFTYFGCYLDVYNSMNQTTFPGSHHCIVAQIAYDRAPIPTATPTGATLGPENWDQLAQRNLQITSSGQPGFPATHRIPQTFDTRPSPLPIFQPNGELLNYPDELMIDWGNTPAGSLAHIYWPQVSSAEVVQTASKLYATHQLSAFDSHTIQCTILGEVTYVPIVNGPGQNFAGLFTVDLPDGIRVGNEFNITVRRLRSAQSFLNNTLAAAPAGRNNQQPFNWRCVVGTFQVKIPVSLEAPLLLPEENLLAILKWRLENMSPVYRWYPVVQRYISIVSARVKGMGGNPSAVAPSQWGVTKPAGGPPGGGPPHPKGVEFTGKVSAINYDRFGDFDGFSLLTEEGHEHSFRGREHEVEEIVNRAWTERIVISVFAERGDRHVPVSIVLRRAPWPYHH
jgi:hypothetical protein